MKISEIMTPDPELIDPTASIRDAARRMKNEDIGALPVGENDRLIGMVTDRDIVCKGLAQDGFDARRTTARRSRSRSFRSALARLPVLRSLATGLHAILPVA